MKLPGINIQYPISQLLLRGSKTVETRLYPLPKKYIGKELLFIETPGETGEFRARIVGTIVFGEPFKYNTKAEFYADYKRHCVDKASPYAWKGDGKWGWPVLNVKKFREVIPAPANRGIRFSKEITI